MNFRPTLALAATTVILVSACSGSGSDQDAIVPIPGAAASGDGQQASADDSTTSSTDSTAPEETSTSVESTTSEDSTTTTSESSTTSSSTTSSTTSSSTTSSTTTTTEPELDVYAPECVHQVQPGDSLGLITDSYEDETITVATVSAENDIQADQIFPDQLLDICVDNGLDDVTGEERDRNAAILESETGVAVAAQQEKLNDLFAGYGPRDLLVDGVSGPVTRQRLCAARLSLGLPVTLSDMEPGSDEEMQLMAAEKLELPFTSSLNSSRWILIDRTCQMMFVGTGAERLDFVFQTSTGEIFHETRDQDRSRMFRFDPALDNDGWHNSTDFPVENDNPLNGNMYKPLYFDGGQAIHGANNVPTTPQSKGCARLRPSDQDALIAWLGLADADGPTNSADRINVTVNVQGEYPHTEADFAAAEAERVADEAAENG